MLAIKRDYDTINYILEVYENGLWNWCWYDELIINNDTLRINDSVSIRGLYSSEKKDIYLRKYYEFSVIDFRKL